MALLRLKQQLFAYFSEQLGDRNWSGKDVLDFGGNVGGLLRDPASTIDEERYWCIDIVQEALEIGRQNHPRAHWIFYDKYNFYFNPHGDPDLAVPNLGTQFDYIVAYSVFTNNFEADMMALVPQLERMLRPGGKLAFTFQDPHYHPWPGTVGSNLRWRLDRIRKTGAGIDVGGIADRAEGCPWCALVNDRELRLNTDDMDAYAVEDQNVFRIFYTTSYMQTLFPRAEILPPANNESQHCCILRKPRE